MADRRGTKVCGPPGERAAALFEVAFDRLDLVAVSHHPENTQSERAIEKYVAAHGGRREGHLRNGLVIRDGTVHDEMRHTVTQTEYRAAVDG